jgi:hypothetical protein
VSALHVAPSPDSIKRGSNGPADQLASRCTIQGVGLDFTRRELAKNPRRNDFKRLSMAIRPRIDQNYVYCCFFASRLELPNLTPRTEIAERRMGKWEKKIGSAFGFRYPGKASDVSYLKRSCFESALVRRMVAKVERRGDSG